MELSIVILIKIILLLYFFKKKNQIGLGVSVFNQSEILKFIPWEMFKYN